MRLPAVLDFETEAIAARPNYPPRPVSFALWDIGGKPEFWSWGHASQNNCTRAQAKRRLQDLWRSGHEVLMHEASFDMDVAEVHFGLPLLPWDRFHDTIFQIFLADPNAEAVDLKSSAERYLGYSQKDQDPLKAWILKHVPGAKKRPSKWAAHMSKLPSKMGAKRALGDVKRTRRLHSLFHQPSEAYDRERQLVAVKLSMERRGMPVDVRGLEKDFKQGTRDLAKIDRWVQKRLKAPDLSIDKREDLADALEDAEIVDEWLMTEPTKTHKEGQRMTGWRALQEVCNDLAVVDVLRYRGMLKAQTITFAKPWLEQARETDGIVYCRFNQVRTASVESRKQVGARTGRLSSTPNLMNVPNKAPMLVRSRGGVEKFKKRNEVLLVPIQGTELLDLRVRVRAQKGHLIGDHDVNQQELRMLAELGGGPLFEAFLANKYTDAHQFVADLVTKLIGKHIIRRDVKAVNFGVLYGEGLAKLARELGITEHEAGILRRACKIALGADTYDRTLKGQGYVDTIGGRHCPVEPPSWVKGEHRTWDYKLINTGLQGSAADQIKAAMIAIDAEYPGTLLFPVHDETVWTAPRKQAKEMVDPISRMIETCIPTRVPMVVAGNTGLTWREAH